MHLARYGLFLCLFQNGGFNHENKWTERLYRNMRTVTSLVGWLSEQEFVPSIACTRLQEFSCSSEFVAEEIAQILEGRAELFDVERAKAFLLISHGSFSGTMTSVGVKTIDTKPILEELPKVIKRISTVFLENQDAFELIKKRDRSDGVIYADPPYFRAERSYEVDFPLENHLLLRNLFRGCKGYVILSYNKCEPIMDLYKDDFFIFSLIRNNPLAQTEGSTYGELLITNFDPRPFMDTQMDLFAPSDDSKWELVLLNVPTHILKT